jgi:hypothetical protein
MKRWFPELKSDYRGSMLLAFKKQTERCGFNLCGRFSCGKLSFPCSPGNQRLKTKETEKIKIMKTQIDIRSTLFGIIVGVLVMFAMGAGTSPNEVGRYRVSVGQGFMVIVDTKTGETWGRPTTTEGEDNDKLGTFWKAK